MKCALTLILLMLPLVIAGCSSVQTDRYGSEPTYEGMNSKADPASYGADGFMVQRYMPIRAPAEVNFYDKQCQQSGQSSFVSKTSYYCDYR